MDNSNMDLCKKMENISKKYEDTCKVYSMAIFNNFLHENPNDPNFSLAHIKLQVETNQKVLTNLQNKRNEEKKRLEKLKRWIKIKQEEMTQNFNLILNPQY